SNKINGATADYAISVVSPLPVLSTDTITFTFPSEPTLPSTLVCSGGTLITSVTCTKIGTSTIHAVLTVNGGTIAAHQTFSFNVINVVNPPSTQETGSFTDIVMNDTTGL